ncbi:MAG: response regulator transcription factor [Lachnospiraceae bacterium]|nr:response regulator transcription factor [Lachnospiraceae bacterium]
MHYNCLLVDDETDLSKMTCEYLEMFEVSCAYVENTAQCMDFLQKNTIDILLLDINLAKESGFDLCKRVREEYQMPILFISARQSDDDVLIALNIGGDDYIKKPYSLSVLLAKIKVILKRIKQQEHKIKTAEASDSGILLMEDKLSVSINGREIALKAKEFALFKCLFTHRNAIVTKEKLFEQVWGDCFYSDGTLNVHIRKLREKLEENPNDPKLIKTIWGTGYMLELEETK